ncbi:class F sortase [Halalkalibacterium ligniniphilum]|uniref:class F sortase n=1 Tax=Halalkalibacterium ligniniphilum TaxID=1134413 RepID=UPI00034D38E4|nr:class F sortase [Halalkalibacterium ligniniphilum]
MHRWVSKSILLLFFTFYCHTSVFAEVSLTGIEPDTIIIPSLSIHASVKGLSKEEINAVPPDGETVFWYRDGVNPGARGSAMLAGHFDDYEGPAVFFELRQINISDMVYLVDKKGEMVMFQVEEITSFPRKQAPIDEVFQMNGEPRLILVTCDGAYDKELRTHSNRLFVKARRVGTSHLYFGRV